MDSFKDVSKFLREEKYYMTSLIVNSVKEAWKNKLDVVQVIEFHVDDNVIKIDIEERDYKRNLLIALDYYESNEFYEECMEVNDLIQSIQFN